MTRLPAVKDLLRDIIEQAGLTVDAFISLL